MYIFQVEKEKRVQKRRYYFPSYNMVLYSWACWLGQIFRNGKDQLQTKRSMHAHNVWNLGQNTSSIKMLEYSEMEASALLLNTPVL